MRVIAGEARGRRLDAPRGHAVRPTGSRLREAVFAMLEHRGAISGARVLDLFAGSGALGIEALSRGGATLTAVEQDRSVARILAANLERCGFAARARVLVEPVEAALARLAGGPPFDLALLDPPYHSDFAAEALGGLDRYRLLASSGIVFVEHARGETIEWGRAWYEELSRRYGDSVVALLRPAQPEARRQEVGAGAIV